MSACTGITATWCPNHGDCTCPWQHPRYAGIRNRAGFSIAVVRLDMPDEPVRTLTDPGCLLHAPTSEHGETPKSWTAAVASGDADRTEQT